MSGIGNRFRTDRAAIWPVIDGSTNGYGDDYGEPTVIKVCQFSDDKVQRDRNGAEFVPLSAYEMGYLPRVGDLIKVVDRNATPLNISRDGNEQTIRSIKQGTELRGSKDYLVYTG